MIDINCITHSVRRTVFGKKNSNSPSLQTKAGLG